MKIHKYIKKEKPILAQKIQNKKEKKFFEDLKKTIMKYLEKNKLIFKDFSDKDIKSIEKLIQLIYLIESNIFKDYRKGIIKKTDFQLRAGYTERSRVPKGVIIKLGLFNGFKEALFWTKFDEVIKNKKEILEDIRNSTTRNKREIHQEIINLVWNDPEIQKFLKRTKKPKGFTNSRLKKDIHAIYLLRFENDNYKFNEMKDIVNYGSKENIHYIADFLNIADFHDSKIDYKNRTRRCNRCRKIKNFDQFRIQTEVNALQPYCRECEYELIFIKMYQKKLAGIIFLLLKKERKSFNSETFIKMIKEIKLGKRKKLDISPEKLRCPHCGQPLINILPSYEIHHKGEKEFSWRDLRGKSLKTIIKKLDNEFKKGTIWLCGNCHVSKTATSVRNVIELINKNQKIDLKKISRNDKRTFLEQQRKIFYINYFGKSNGNCYNCGSISAEFNPECFQFHHFHPVIKLYEFSDDLKTIKDKELVIEIMESEEMYPLCRNCHATEESIFRGIEREVFKKFLNNEIVNSLMKKE